MDGRDQVCVLSVRIAHLHVGGRGEPRVFAEKVVEHSVLQQENLSKCWLLAVAFITYYRDNHQLVPI